MSTLARKLEKKELDDGPHSFPIDAEAKRIRETGEATLESDQVITYAGRLMIGYRRDGRLYSAADGGYYIANDPSRQSTKVEKTGSEN